MADLLKVTREDADVLDPFMGAPSVGEACVATGRGYIGIEPSPEYFEVRRLRLETCIYGRKQVRLLTEPGTIASGPRN